MQDCWKNYIPYMVLYINDITELEYNRSSRLPVALIKTFIDLHLSKGQVLYCDNSYVSPELFNPNLPTMTI